MILKDNSSINKVDIKPKTQRHKKKISTKALTVLTHSLDIAMEVQELVLL